MSSIQERLQLKRVPLDTWNVREQLCLASAVVRSGDQNWMSVSRALKTVGEPNRPVDWYSQKSCAAQYGALLEHVETPKRKKRSSEGAAETPQESILKRLTQERIAEIQKNVAELTQQYEIVKNEIQEVRNPHTSEDRVRELWTSIEAAKRARERENARRAAWLREREERRSRAERTWRPPTQQGTGTSPQSVCAPSSPLLTSLLKSSPVVTTPQILPHPATVVETVSPSAGAPTLSMLLEKSPPPAAVHAPAPAPAPAPALVLAPSQDSKHAAIEHIKSQLVQIEQQLKAGAPSTPPLTVPSALPAPSPSPLPAPLPSPLPTALDIDDIEIKAEDVYAFRDIDIHIPPVAPMPKSNNRTPEKHKKEDHEILTTDIIDDQSMEEEKNEQITIETVAEPLPVADSQPEDAVTSQEALPEPDIKISFPEVKFPTTEIKVIQDENKIKEEVKEPEVALVEPEKEVEVEKEAEVEEITLPVTEEQSEEPPPVPEVTVPSTESCEEDPVTSGVDPSGIPLPPGPAPEDAIVQPPALEVEAPPVDPPEVPVVPAEEQQQPETQTEETVATEVQPEVKNEVEETDAEDSLSLKEIIKEEQVAPSVPEPEIKEEVQPEAEETHTETDDDTPMELSREEEKDGKKKRDYSRKKKPDSRTCSGSESAAEASAPESPLASDAERQHKLWKKSVMLVYSRLCAHKYASLFVRPISDEEAPGYSAVVRRPMDLTTIRRNIEAGVIRTTAEFQRDVLLMLSNALMYNSTEHSVYVMAKEMHDEAASQLGILVAAHCHAGLAPAPPVRRKRRRRTSPPHDVAAHRRLH